MSNLTSFNSTDVASDGGGFWDFMFPPRHVKPTTVDAATLVPIVCIFFAVVVAIIAGAVIWTVWYRCKKGNDRYPFNAQYQAPPESTAVMAVQPKK